MPPTGEYEISALVVPPRAEFTLPPKKARNEVGDLQMPSPALQVITIQSRTLHLQDSPNVAPLAVRNFAPSAEPNELGED